MGRAIEILVATPSACTRMGTRARRTIEERRYYWLDNARRALRGSRAGAAGAAARPEPISAPPSKRPAHSGARNRAGGAIAGPLPFERARAQSAGPSRGLALFLFVSRRGARASALRGARLRRCLAASVRMSGSTSSLKMVPPPSTALFQFMPKSLRLILPVASSADGAAGTGVWNAQDRQVERHLLGHALHRQVAGHVHLSPLLVTFLDLNVISGILLDVEEVGALQVPVALLVVGVDRAGLDGAVDRERATGPWDPS